MRKRALLTNTINKLYELPLDIKIKIYQMAIQSHVGDWKTDHIISMHHCFKEWKRFRESEKEKVDTRSYPSIIGLLVTIYKFIKYDSFINHIID